MEIVPFLSVAAFRKRTVMPSADVDELEVQEPDFLTETLADVSETITNQLAKRYVVPFVAPFPRTLLRWLTAIVTLEAYIKRGSNPSSLQDERIVESAKQADAQIAQAADSKDGLFDLPLRADTVGASGVSLGGPLGYAEASPYDWTDVQREAVSRG